MRPAVDQVVGCVSLKVFEASDFTSHPLFSVGGVDLQQVSGGGGLVLGSDANGYIIFSCFLHHLTRYLRGADSERELLTLSWLSVFDPEDPGTRL